MQNSFIYFPFPFPKHKWTNKVFVCPDLCENIILEAISIIVHPFDYCYGLKCDPQNSYVEGLTYNVIVFGC